MLIETRGNDGVREKFASFKDALLHPSASFGGLWSLPEIPRIDIESLINASYNELVCAIFAHLKVDLDFKSALDSYQNFDSKNAPVSYEIEGDMILQNLYSGPTRAFKDMAMQPFGRILCDLAKSQSQKYLILSATSGDTGPATLSAIKNKENVFGVCLYPHGGTSEVQRLQMNVNAPNIRAFAIDGDFDAAQSALKSLLNDSDFSEFLRAHNFEISATNSINIGRIIFQIIYHVHSYVFLLKNGIIKKDEEINIVVPSGNFGNALGAFWAREMGAKIHKIIIATNANDVLCDLIKRGVYDISARKLIPTNSPAMDILKSSNVERVLFALFGAARTKELMENLQSKKRYELKDEELARLSEIFDCFSSDDESANEVIKKFWAKNLFIDPHTANGIVAHDALKMKYKNLKHVVCATAEWSKFAPTIANAIFGANLAKNDDARAISMLSAKFPINLHENIRSLFYEKKNYAHRIKKEEIKTRIQEWLCEIGG